MQHDTSHHIWLPLTNSFSGLILTKDDYYSIFRFVKHKGIHVTYTVGEDEGKIQFKRALESLGIGAIYAHSRRPRERVD